MPAEDALRGRRILVPRPGRRGEGLARALRERGALPDVRPAIAFDPPQDPAPAARAAAALERFDWIVVTSPTGVESLQRCRADLERVEGPRFAAIGPGTARRLELAGRSPDLVADRSDSAGLAAALSERVQPGQAVLVVRPEVASEAVPTALRELGASVQAVAFYRTVPHPEASAVARSLCAGDYDGAVFTSPSTLRALLDVDPAASREVHAALRRIRRVAIGRVTAAALDAEGLPPHATAERPTDDAVVRAIADAFEDAGGTGPVC
jgi:uroporphyrinogen-III synthase